MPDKPSWQSSTLSQLLTATVLLYGIGTVVLMVKGKVTDLIPLQWLLNILLPLYGVKRGIEAAKNGNGRTMTSASPLTPTTTEGTSMPGSIT